MSGLYCGAMNGRRILAVAATILALAACAVTPPGERLDGAAGPRFNPSGPEREAYGGTLTGFARATASNFWQTPYLVDSHSRFDEIFPSRRVAKASAPSRLRRAPAEPQIGFRFADAPRTLDDYLARHPTTGLLIARGDTILVERYQYDRRDTHRFQSWSMAKTVTSMLVGIAIDEGRIKSVDDLAEAYVPELRGTEYGRTPLRHLLTMSSGVKFIEDYSGTDDSPATRSSTSAAAVRPPWRSSTRATSSPARGTTTRRPRRRCSVSSCAARPADPSRIT